MSLWIFGILLAGFVTCAPPVLVEMNVNELDEIKYALADQLVDYTDDNYRTAIYNALDYVEVHSIRYTLWKNFPMDLTMFFGFAGFCATYIIGLLQFTY
ncbi:uncharacterized protein LOC134200040 [Bombyx mori]